MVKRICCREHRKDCCKQWTRQDNETNLDIASIVTNHNNHCEKKDLLNQEDARFNVAWGLSAEPANNCSSSDEEGSVIFIPDELENEVANSTPGELWGLSGGELDDEFETYPRHGRWAESVIRKTKQAYTCV